VVGPRCLTGEIASAAAALARFPERVLCATLVFHQG